MNPHQPERLVQLTVGLLLIAAMMVVLLDHQRRDLNEQLDGERHRRLEAEGRVRQRDVDLDGALAKIHTLVNDDD
jgi:hypothetical protein